MELTLPLLEFLAIIRTTKITKNVFLKCHSER
jgi:hypothetical protein